MTTPGKTFTFVLSTSGCGTHLLMDCFRRAPVRFFDHRLVEFWVAYVQARHDPTAGTRSDFFPDRSALDVVRGFYKRFDMDWGGDPLSESRAIALFGRMLDQAGPRLASAHNYELIVPSPWTLIDEPTPAWNSAFSDEARGLFEGAVTAAGYRLDTLILMRHPIDVFLSSLERTGDRTPETAIYANTEAFFRLANDYARRPSTAVVRYEDLCRGEEGAMALLARISGLDEADLDAELFAGGEVAKYRRYPRRRIAAIAERLAGILPISGYRADIPSPVGSLFLMIVSSFRRWAGEIRALNAVFAGDLRAPNAVFRRRRSLVGRIYWQLSMLSPWRRRNYIRAYEMLHPWPMPTPRYERPFRRILGLPIVE